jgi:hypothetical protein
VVTVTVFNDPSSWLGALFTSRPSGNVKQAINLACDEGHRMTTSTKIYVNRWITREKNAKGVSLSG